ncbi:MAG: hypothetical protein ACI4XF_07605 [Oscillospiraceae bacterium]
MTEAAASNVRAAKKPSAAVHYGKMLAKRNMKYAVLALFMNFLGLPLFLIHLISECVITKNINAKELQSFNSVFDAPDNTIYILIAVIGTFVAVVTGVYIAMGSFSHLYDKNLVDMEYSLPLTADERFFAGFLSGLTLYLVPYIICQMISLILIAAGHLVIDKWLDPLQQIFADFMPLAVKLIIGGLIIMLMFYTLFVLTMSFCGSKFETTAYGMGANLCLPVIYACLFVTVEENGYGLVFGLSDDTLINQIFGCTSPMGALYGMYLSAFVNIDHIATSESFFSVFSFGFWIIKCLAVTALLIFCALKLYRRRKAEQTGKNFVSKTFYYVVMVCLMMLTCTFMEMIGADLAPTIIITAVIFLIMDSISNRGVRKLHVSLLKYIAVMLGIFGVYATTINTGFFGAVNYVPEASEIKCAELVDYDGYAYGDALNGNYRFEDEENIQAIIDIHNKQLEIHNSMEPVSPVDHITIKYTYKNGRVKTRAYHIYGAVHEMLLPLETCDEIKAEKTEALSNTLDCKTMYFIKDSGYDMVQDVKYYPYEDRYLFKSDFIPTLKECLAEDINNMSSEDYIRCTGMSKQGTEMWISVGCYDESFAEPEGMYYDSFRILGCYEKTLDYLSSLNIM